MYGSLDGCIGEGVERGDTGFRVGRLMRKAVEDGIREENSWEEGGGERGRERETVTTTSFARLLYSIAEYNVGKRSLHHNHLSIFGGSQKPHQSF